MSKRNIIVTGATGKQGRAFIRALLNPSSATDQAEAPYHVWAVTRNPSSSAAARLLGAERSHARAITVTRGDLNDAARMRAIFAQVAAEGGIFGAFVVLAYPGLGKKSEEEERQGKTLADLALEFKVEAFVYSSTIPPGPDMDDAKDASHRSKKVIEAYCQQLGETGLNWINVRPGFFMENFDGFLGSMAVAIFSQGLGKDTNITLVAAEDIGRVAAGIFQDHEQYLHKAVSITGCSETIAGITAAYKDVTGNRMPSAPAFLAKLLLKTNAGAQNVIKEIERHYEVRSSGKYPSFDAEVELARSVCKLQDYRSWLLGRKRNGT